jgi:DNA uptake protein ComE-like DNA-binding protein
MAFLHWLSAVTPARPDLALASRALKARMAKDPFYRFQSCEEIQLAAALGLKIDVNQATVDDWLRLPGLSIHQGRLLTQLAQSGVQFFCVEDIAAALGIPTQRLKPLEPIMQFCFYDQAGVDAIERVNPNTAPIERLAQIPGMDAGLAKAIVHHRRTAAYKNLADMQQRLHLPSQITANLMHYLWF